jgi:hypothetical protein
MQSRNGHHHPSDSDGAANLKRNEQYQDAKYNTDDDKENQDEEFPGYPHYPSNEDITKQMERVPVDVENLAPAGSVANPVKKPETAASFPQESVDDEVKIVPGTEADVTREDLRMLNATEGAYADAANSSTVTGEDLDVPGADEDDPNEDIGEEDEENNYYSLGGENHENLEEDRS